MALGRALVQLNRYINQNSGRLPGAAVVSSRRVTDALREIIETSEVRPLEVHAQLAVNGILHDYLPTTLRAYLCVDDSLRNVARQSGATPTESLLEQLDALRASALAVLTAAQHQDADAVMTQGSFLRTKFSGSDLDL